MQNDIEKNHDTDSQQIGLESLTLQNTDEVEYSQQMQMQHQAEDAVCHNCGAMNEKDSTFCASCGSSLGATYCPHCGNEIDMNTDYCEVCHHYIAPNVCSFCGSHLVENDAYCPECGSSRGGIVCPVCHTLNEFSFCKRCGTPLTEEAKMALETMKEDKTYMELVKIAEEYSELDNHLPYNDKEDKVSEQVCDELRKRVLTLLAEEDGNLEPQILPKASKRIDANELKHLKEFKQLQISMLLEKLQMPQMPSSAKARNYAMATKPAGLRLGWICNYKNALHSGPCACTKPQLGGKWVVLNGKNEKTNEEKIF
jgi:predicted amidophosphoribosyltransferase